MMEKILEEEEKGKRMTLWKRRGRKRTGRIWRMKRRKKRMMMRVSYLPVLWLEPPGRLVGLNKR
jgi:hypothetical protein